MSKLKFIIRQREYNLKKNSDRPFDYSYCKAPIQTFLGVMCEKAEAQIGVDIDVVSFNELVNYISVSSYLIKIKAKKDKSTLRKYIITLCYNCDDIPKMFSLEKIY